MSTWHSQLEFPVIAFSRAGWSKEAVTASDLCDASPDDSLDEWQRLQIYDSAGRHFTAIRAFREWPRTLIGRWLCKLFGNSIRVGFELSPPERVSVEELRQRVGGIERLSNTASHRQILEYVCS